MTTNKETAQAGSDMASHTAFDSRHPGNNVKKPFWLPIDVESYRADTADLSTVEHGAFFLMRLHYWRAGPLKDNDVVLARITGLSLSEWRQIRPSLERFFNIHGEWINWEWSNELDTAYAHIKKASAAGKKAADARWEKERNCKANASGSDMNRIRSASELECERNANYKVGGKPPRVTLPAKPSDVFLSKEEEADLVAAEARFLGVSNHA